MVRAPPGRKKTRIQAHIHLLTFVHVVVTHTARLEVAFLTVAFSPQEHMFHCEDILGTVNPDMCVCV
jgi:hypothetical protein